MSQGYKNGAFALGLVTGIGIAINLVLWVEYQSKREGGQQANFDSDLGGEQSAGWLDRFIAALLSPSGDTIAQWTMAIFAVVAVILVWRTLIATQEMAVDARAIGEAQATSYLVLQYLGTWPRSDVIKITYSAVNIGTTPAHDVKLMVRLRPNATKVGVGMEPYSKRHVIHLGAVEGGGKKESFTGISKHFGDTLPDRWPEWDAVKYCALVDIYWTDVFGQRHHGWFFANSPDPDFDRSNSATKRERMLVASCGFDKVKIGDEEIGLHIPAGARPEINAVR